MDRLGAFGLPPDEALFREPANNYTAVMNALSAAVATSGSRFVWALQPTIFEKQYLTDIEKKRVEEIAKIKMEDLNAASMEAAMRIIEGTARSAGIAVED